MARKEEAMVELEIKTLARRLDTVERENRRLKRAGVATTTRGLKRSWPNWRRKRRRPALSDKAGKVIWSAP